MGIWTHVPAPTQRPRQAVEPQTHLQGLQPTKVKPTNQATPTCCARQTTKTSTPKPARCGVVNRLHARQPE